MSSSSLMIQGMVSSTGQLLTDLIPVGEYIFGFIIAGLGVLVIASIMRKGAKKLAR